MRFYTAFVVLTAGVMAFAGAVPETAAKRSIADVQTACTALINKADAIAPKLSSCSDNACTATLVGELVDSIHACNTALGTLSRGSQSGSGTIADTVANAVAVSLDEFLRSDALYSQSSQKIASDLSSLKTSCGSKCSNLATNYATVDSSLSACVQAALNAFTGLKSLVVSRYVLHIH